MSASHTVGTVLCVGFFAVLWGSAAAAQPTGQERAEAAGRGLVGSPAPALVVRTIDGESIDLGALYGKQAVYLKFWATWCGPCRAQMPHFKQIHASAGAGLAVIGIDTGFNDSLADVRAAIGELGLEMPTVIDDGRLAAAFNLRVTPQHVVIGRDGLIAYVGHLADEKLDGALRAAQSTPNSAGGRAGAPVPDAIERYGIGDTLPDFSAATLDGTAVRLSDASERRPSVLMFLSPWCETYYAPQPAAPSSGASRPARPALAESCREVREQITSLAGRTPGVRWLGVASGLWSTPDELREYETEHALGIPLTLDESGEWFRAFDVIRVPTIVIADARGKIVRRVEGFDEGLESEVARAAAR
jgi:peroxiredoxin